MVEQTKTIAFMKKTSLIFNLPLFILVPLLLLSSCQTLEDSSVPHSVTTLDRLQVEQLKCVYLYRASKTDTGWSTANATANALYSLKNQAMVAEGNAVVINSASPTTEWQNGYEADAVYLEVYVYKCPFKNEK